jgi:hypothetical protein
MTSSRLNTLVYLCIRSCSSFVSLVFPGAIHKQIVRTTIEVVINVLEMQLLLMNTMKAEVNLAQGRERWRILVTR